MNQPPSALARAADSVFERLRLMRACPMCGAAYREEQAVVLDADGPNHLVHLNCSRCHNALLTMVVVSALGMSSVGVVTDLSPADADRLGRQPPVTEEQVLAFHQLLRRAHQFEIMVCHAFDHNSV